MNTFLKKKLKEKNENHQTHKKQTPRVLFCNQYTYTPVAIS